MRSLAPLLAVFLLTSAIVQAGDLGCTESVLRHKYGAPTSTEKNPAAEKTITFEKPGTLIEVELRKGKCVSVSVTKIGEQLSLAEAKRILDDNAQGQKWLHDDKSPEVYRRGDGTTAYVNPGFITIATPDQEKLASGINVQPTSLPAGGASAPSIMPTGGVLSPTLTPAGIAPAPAPAPQQDSTAPGK